jgi:hypothetical protein
MSMSGLGIMGVIACQDNAAKSSLSSYLHSCASEEDQPVN